MFLSALNWYLSAEYWSPSIQNGRTFYFSRFIEFVIYQWLCLLYKPAYFIYGMHCLEKNTVNIMSSEVTVNIMSSEVTVNIMGSEVTVNIMSSEVTVNIIGSEVTVNIMSSEVTVDVFRCKMRTCRSIM